MLNTNIVTVVVAAKKKKKGNKVKVIFGGIINENFKNANLIHYDFKVRFEQIDE